MTGAGTAAMLGYPDFGLVTMSEMVANAGRIAAAVELPVIADADTGYGNELNVVRTVRAYETARVAGIHIEDQEFPKKCGHLDDKRIVPGLLIKNIVGICEKMLDELRATHRHPAPVREMTVRETFQLWGADEWDALRTRFRDPADARREAAE